MKEAACPPLHLLARCELEMTSCTVLEEEKWRNKRLVVFDRERHGDLIQVNDIDEVVK